MFKEVKALKHKAVILGSNYYIGLSAIRCLGENGIHTVAVDYDSKERYGAKSKYCSEIVTSPHYLEETEESASFWNKKTIGLATIGCILVVMVCFGLVMK